MEIVEIIKTSTICVFIFFLLNFATILEYPISKFYKYIDLAGGKKTTYGYMCRKLRYMLGCIFCLTFWYCLAFDINNLFYSPVFATIINSLFLKSFSNLKKTGEY
jgi:hypothetical protein